MDDLAFIVGLMKHNTSELGFVPATTIAQRYIPAGQYIIQSDAKGKRRGYILHGKPSPGGVLTIAQAVIEVDYRQRGYGEAAVGELLARAEQANVRQIRLHCAADMEANGFWLAQGFVQTKVIQPANWRKRAIITYVKDLWPLLLKVK